MHPLSILIALALAGSPSACAADRPQTSREEARPDGAGEIVRELPDSLWCVFHDQDGAYWFGSDGQGVYRLDGETITRFTTRDGLGNDRVRGIQQHGPTGDLIVSTLGGVSRFDGRRFTPLPVTDVALPDEGWELNADDVWLPWQPLQRGPYRYDGETLYHLKFATNPLDDPASPPSADLERGWSSYEVYCTYKDRRGHLWFGTAALGIYRFDGESVDWMYEDPLTNTPKGASFGIRSILEDKNGDFWFCNTRHRYAIQPHGETGVAPGSIAYERKPGIDLAGTVVADESFYFMSIVEDERGHLWMATYAQGLFEYDGEKLTHHPLKDDEDKDITAFSVTRDRNGSLWVGTHENGAYRFNGTEFERFRP